MRTILLLLLVFAWPALAAEHLPEDVQKAYTSGAPVEMWALDGKEFKDHVDHRGLPQDGTFYRQQILGHTTFTGAERQRVVDALLHGIVGGTDDAHPCFRPHHGLRVTYQKHVYDLVVCFMCSQLECYVDGQWKGRVGIDETPRFIFNQALLDHKVTQVPLVTTDFKRVDHFHRDASLWLDYRTSVALFDGRGDAPRIVWKARQYVLQSLATPAHVLVNSTDGVTELHRDGSSRTLVEATPGVVIRHVYATAQDGETVVVLHDQNGISLNRYSAADPTPHPLPLPEGWMDITVDPRTADTYVMTHDTRLVHGGVSHHIPHGELYQTSYLSPDGKRLLLTSLPPRSVETNPLTVPDGKFAAVLDPETMSLTQLPFHATTSWADAHSLFYVDSGELQRYDLQTSRSTAVVSVDDSLKDTAPTVSADGTWAACQMTFKDKVDVAHTLTILLDLKLHEYRLLEDLGTPVGWDR